MTETQNTNSIKRSMAAGAALYVLSKTLNRGLGLISTMILARILAPDDYGIIAMAMSFYAFIEIMAALGVDVVLIQKDTLQRSDYDSAWSIKLVLYFVLSTTLYLGTPIISAFYEEPKLVPVLHILSFSMFLTGIENVKLVDFRRNLQFKKEFWFQFLVKLSGFVVTVPLAFWLQNYWALVAGMVASRSASLILSYVFIPYRPSICFTDAKHIIHFSKWLLAVNILQFFDRKLPHLIIGKLLGAKSLGIYSLSAELANYPSTELCAPINRALFPGYARLKDRANELRNTYLDVLGILTLIVLPAGFGIAATSEYVVQVVLGDQWSDVAEPLGLLAIAFAVFALSSNAGYVYYALGKPRISFFATLGKMALLTPLLFYLVNSYQLVGAALAYLIVCAVMPLVHYAIISSQLETSIWKIINVQYRPLLASCFMYFLLQWDTTKNITASLPNDFITLIAAVTIGFLAYIIFLTFLWLPTYRKESPEKRVIFLAISLIKKKRPAENITE